MVLLTGMNEWIRLLALLVVFVFVLGITAFTTRWIGQYQKQQFSGQNIELLDCARLTNNKYIQIVRVGEKYFAIAVCKDTVTMLCEVHKEMLQEGKVAPQRFQDLFAKVINKDSGNQVK